MKIHTVEFIDYIEFKEMKTEINQLIKRMENEYWVLENIKYISDVDQDADWLAACLLFSKEQAYN